MHIHPLTASVVSVAAFSLVATSAAESATTSSGPDSRPTATRPALPDAAPLEGYQGRLLELAYGAASAYPIVPHVKNRSRAQEDVVNASLKLGQPARALRYVKGIENWRRGAGFARVAAYCARHGHVIAAKHYIERAKRIAQAQWLETWRRDGIRVEIAKAQMALGRTELAKGYGTSVVPSERGELMIARIDSGKDRSFQQRLERIRSLVESEELGAAKNALRAYAALYGHVYDDPDKRKRVRGRMEKLLAKMPRFLRVERLMGLAERAIEAGGERQALAFLDKADSTMDGAEWRLHRAIAYRSRLAEIRYRAGAQDEGLKQLEAQLKRFRRKASGIEDLHRASALRPIAEAFAHMGLIGRSHEIYKRAVVAGAKNPNIRPRISDFVATCCSMAVHEVSPDQGLWTRLEQIRKGLGRD